MATVISQLEAAILALPRDERARLARWLLERLDDDPEVENLWEAGVLRRVEAYERAEIETVSAAEAFERARKRLEKRTSSSPSPHPQRWRGQRAATISE